MKISKKFIKKNIRIIAFLWLLQNWFMPIILSFIVIGTGFNYIDTTDIPFEYLGKEQFNIQESKSVEISSALYGSIDYDFWAYIADNEEEYRINYGECGMNKDICQSVDFEDYILIMSVNRPISAIRVMESYPVWEDAIPYSYPQFVFERKKEEYMVYYYKVYRIDTKYQRQGKEIVSRLKLWMEPYSERKSNKNPKPEPMIESWGPFKNWKWAFDLYNHV